MYIISRDILIYRQYSHPNDSTCFTYSSNGKWTETENAVSREICKYSRAPLEVWNTKIQRKKKGKSCAKSLSHVWFFATPCTTARQVPLLMGILQARILEWFAMPFSRVSLQPRDRTQVSHIAGRFFTIWATQHTPLEV